MRILKSLIFIILCTFASHISLALVSLAREDYVFSFTDSKNEKVIYELTYSISDKKVVIELNEPGLLGWLTPEVERLESFYVKSLTFNANKYMKCSDGTKFYGEIICFGDGSDKERCCVQYDPNKQEIAIGWRDGVTYGFADDNDVEEFQALKKLAQSQSKTAPNSSSNSAKSGSNSTTTKKANTNRKWSKAELDQLKKMLTLPLGYMSPDTYRSYFKSVDVLKQKYPDCNPYYENSANICIDRTNGLSVGGNATKGFFLDNSCDKIEWKYVFNDQTNLSSAKNFCDNLASMIKGLGITLTNSPSDSFPACYEGVISDKKINLSACSIIDYYYITLTVSEPKDISTSELNPTLTLSELFDRPLGAPKGENPLRWYMGKGFYGKVTQDKQTLELTRTGLGSLTNSLTIHLPIQGSTIYEGLQSKDFELKMTDMSSGHIEPCYYHIIFNGELKQNIYKWGINEKQKKKEVKILWEQLINELKSQGHNLVKVNKKTSPAFSKHNAKEGFEEIADNKTRTYLLCNSNQIEIIEETKR